MRMDTKRPTNKFITFSHGILQAMALTNIYLILVGSNFVGIILFIFSIKNSNNTVDKDILIKHVVFYAWHRWLLSSLRSISLLTT